MNNAMSFNHKEVHPSCGKRILDLVFSTLGLVLSSWLWACIAILIILEDGFPILIVQRRIGKDGKFFRSFKFRSMRKHTLNETVNPQALEHDPRVTRVGRVLRKTAMDELPQLLNIFLGDMSFVGPRALLPYEIEVYANGGCLDIREIPGYEKRIVVLPGLTGIAQVYADRNLPRHHKFKYDLLYIKKQCFWLDIRLIIVSFLVTFTGGWEKRSTKLQFLDR